VPRQDGHGITNGSTCPSRSLFSKGIILRKDGGAL